MFEVEFVSKRVKKEMLACTKAEQVSLTEALNQLKTNPRPHDMDFDHLNRNKDIKRIKVGRVRVLYTINEMEHTISIGRFEQRDGVTYKQDPKEWFRRSASTTHHLTCNQV